MNNKKTTKLTKKYNRAGQSETVVYVYDHKTHIITLPE